MKNYLLTAFLLLSSAVLAAGQALPTPIPMPSVTCLPTPAATPIQSCTPWANPSCTPANLDAGVAPSPLPTPIPAEFQNPALPPDTLKWRIFRPSGSGPWPGVIVIHGGTFDEGGYFGEDVETVATDLASKGYYTVIVNYRLAPCHLIAGQDPHSDPASGRPPQQTDDIEAEVRALRADRDNCTGKVAVLGGSAGGSHALFAGFNKLLSSGWPNWGPNDRPDAIVALSPAVDFSDRTAESYDIVPRFASSIENYTNTCIRIDPVNPATGPSQKTVSPVALMTYSDIRPIFAVNTQRDQGMPWHQIRDLQCALQTVGASTTLYRVWTIPGSSVHSFGNWTSPIRDTDPVIHSIKVRDRVIEFLDANLKTP